MTKPKRLPPFSDVYLEVAKRLFGPDPTPEQRAEAKRCTWLSLYGGSPIPSSETVVEGEYHECDDVW